MRAMKIIWSKEHPPKVRCVGSESGNVTKCLQCKFFRGIDVSTKGLFLYCDHPVRRGTTSLSRNVRLRKNRRGENGKT